MAVHLQPISKILKDYKMKVGVGAGAILQTEGRRRRRNRRRRRRSRRRAVVVDPMARTEKGRRRRGTWDTDYGGIAHNDTTKDKLRPEAVKSERCDDRACHMCNHQTDDGCWHGSSLGSGDMTLAVEAKSLFKSFAQEVFFKCSIAGGRWNMRVYAIDNGKIDIYANNKLEKTISQVIAEKFDFNTASLRVRAVFVPNDRNLASGAKAKFEVFSMNTTSDACMTTKMCLSTLGDGSDSGFELRNNNKLQAMCLISGASSLASHLLTTCLAWLECLSEENKNILKALLTASGQVGSPSPSDSFADDASKVNDNLTASDDPNDCVNPRVDDPESYDCECVEDMIKTCEGVDEACFKGIMCNSAEVCQSWKDSEECASLIQTNEGDMSADLVQRSQDSASSAIGDALDGSLAGKCSQ